MERDSFDLIIQAVLKQKQLMERLVDENWQLRRQLADLREARGIFVDIDGRRFWLSAQSSQIAPATTPPANAPLHASSGTSDTTSATNASPTIAIGLIEPQQGEEEEEESITSPTILQEGIDNAFCEQPTTPIERPLEKAECQEASKEPEAVAQ
jgi:hypothetical protein